MKGFERKYLLLALLFVTLKNPFPNGEEATHINLSHNISIIQASELEPAITKVSTFRREEIIITKGDNLSNVFQLIKLNTVDLHEITNSPQGETLSRIHPGQKLEFLINRDGQLQAMKHIKDPLNVTLFQRQPEGFQVKHIQLEPELRKRWKTITIKSSLYKDAYNDGLNRNLIIELVNIFSGIVNFSYDIQSGDNFSILYEESYINGSKLGKDSILAALYTNKSQTYKAYRYTDANANTGYYNEHGISLLKTFLLAPLEFTRISSRFNPKRFHPIINTLRPHRGVDYAAAQGTPIYASGDGLVYKSAYSKANGNYIIIKHGEKYTTKYLHLHKRFVKAGSKVMQREIIGLVGATGYATGPHLHYEFIIDGVHKNARTIHKELPKANSIAPEYMNAFLAKVSNLERQISLNNSRYILSSAIQIIDRKTQ